MPLPDFDLSGAPNPSAMWANSVLLQSLYHEDISATEKYAEITGALNVLTKFNTNNWPPSYTLFSQGNDVLIVIAGTTSVPQALSHIGSFINPVVDPVTGYQTLQSFLTGAVSIKPEIEAFIGPLAGKNLRISGHSYGAAVGLLIAQHWIKDGVTSSSIQLLSFGEPRSIISFLPPTIPDIYYRITNSSDPVVYMPPKLSYLTTALPIAPGLPVFRNFSWRVIGQEFSLSDTSVERYLPSGPAYWLDLLAGAVIAESGFSGHYMETFYSPYSFQAWQRTGLNPEYKSLAPFALSYQSVAVNYPYLVGQATTPSQQGAAWYPTQPNPINAGNQDEFLAISTSAYLVSSFGGSPVPTQMKGSFLFGLGTGGFSESLYSLDTSMDYAGMLATMQQLLPLRTALSFCADQGACDNPLECVGIRVEDELVNRDAITTPIGQTPPGWTVTTLGPSPQDLQNMYQEVSAKVAFRGLGSRQKSFVYLHGVPVDGTSDGGGKTIWTGMLRNTSMAVRWISALGKYLNAIIAGRLGFRNFNSPWDISATGKPGPMAKPTAMTYDAATQWYTATMGQAFPTVPGPMEVRLRGFKNLPFLNGTWPCSVSPSIPNGIVIQRKCRNVVWDTTGYVSPVVWNYYIPNALKPAAGGGPPGVQYQFLTSKKIGRPFFLEPGRARRRAV